MTQKLTSAITKVTLNDATFHNKVFTPAYINFLFGNNGCGKSTISRSIKRTVGLEWEDGRTADDFNLLVYNEDFIKRNIASYGGLPGVFTISEQNAEIQQKIDETTSLLGDAQKALSAASAELGTREVSSPNTLVNVIRQILDYYFLQLCGYSGVSIKDEILKKNRDKFVLPLPDGTEDATELHMASSLLQYLCTSNDRISDGLNFIHTSVDTASCRKIFEKIFRHMGQGQHYDMMMNRVL